MSAIVPAFVISAGLVAATETLGTGHQGLEESDHTSDTVLLLVRSSPQTTEFRGSVARFRGRPAVAIWRCRPQAVQGAYSGRDARAPVGRSSRRTRHGRLRDSR